MFDYLKKINISIFCLLFSLVNYVHSKPSVDTFFWMNFPVEGWSSIYKDGTGFLKDLDLDSIGILNLNFETQEIKIKKLSSGYKRLPFDSEKQSFSIEVYLYKISKVIKLSEKKYAFEGVTDDENFFTGELSLKKSSKYIMSDYVVDFFEIVINSNSKKYPNYKYVYRPLRSRVARKVRNEFKKIDFGEEVAYMGGNIDFYPK